jgi:Holliday junction resolvasome RuvABC endonuclease subunit
MDVLGVDHSLTMTGLAKHADETTSLDRIGSGTTPDGDLGAVRTRVRYLVGGTLRFAPLRCLSVIEAPYIPRHNAGAVLERAWLFGILVDQLMTRGPVVQVRTKVRAMYATDNGNAEKPEVLAAMRAKFPDLTIRDDNEADALALLCMGARYLGAPIDGPMSKKQQQAMTTTVWPSTKEIH